MAAGITQPGGAGTAINIYDDTSTAGGRAAGPYTFAQISAAFPVDFVDQGTTSRKSYRGKVGITMGSGTVPTGGPAITTLQDTKVDVIFDSAAISQPGYTTSFAYPNTCYIKFGTRFDVGSRAGWKDGCDITFGAAFNNVFNLELYDTHLRQTAGVLNLSGSDFATDIQRVVGCVLQSSVTGTQPSQFGAQGGNLDQFLDCLLSYDTTAFCINNISLDQGERLSLSCATPTAFIRSGGSGVAVKDLRVVGSPTTSDFIWTGAGAISWTFIRPVYSQGGNPKFSIVAGNLPLNGATVEYWLYDVTVTDGLGNAVMGIPVKLTDNFGTVVVNTTSDANGAITFNTIPVGTIGNLISGNAVPVMDHYTVGGVYTQRHRSPFLVEINTGTGANPNYAPQRYYMKWPGTNTITTTAGTFEDVADVVSLNPASGGPTIWTELNM